MITNYNKGVAFEKIDELGAGLREEIQRQKLSQSAINLFEQPTEQELRAYIEGMMALEDSDLGQDMLELAA